MNRSKTELSGTRKKRKKTKLGNFIKYFRGHWQLYVMLFIPLCVLIIFAYLPMAGIVVAFKDYKASLGIFDSPWTSNFGMNNFIRFFNNYNFAGILRNTLVISLYSLAVNIPTAIILALALNYTKNVRFKKASQMITYLPYFISIIVFVGIINLMFDTRTGVLGSFLYNTFGTNILGSASAFPHLYVWTGVLQGVGFNSVIYLAALSNVSIELHEAALIDGATLLQRIRHIDLPAVMPTAVTMLILNMGSVLNVGHEKILAMQNYNNISTSEIISTYEYKVSLASSYPDYSYATAIGLFRSVVGLILIVLANKVANKVSDGGFL